ALEVLDRWVKQERARIEAAPDQSPPDAGVLTEALSLQLHALPAGADLGGCAFLTPRVNRSYVNLVIQLQGKSKFPRVGILVDNEPSAAAVSASFNHGKKLRDAGHAEK